MQILPASADKSEGQNRCLTPVWVLVLTGGKQLVPGGWKFAPGVWEIDSDPGNPGESIFRTFGPFLKI